MSKRIRSKSGSVVALAITLQTFTVAEAAAQVRDPVTGDGPDIIVTAEKRASNLQDVPLSIAAVSGSTLASSGVNSVVDLPVAVAGLQVNRTGPNGFLFLRGLGTAINPIGADPSVAVYKDGLYRPRTRDTLIDFLDVARVEVLKGPQGTLYGRNAVGGTINIISNLPTSRFEGSVDLELGNYGLFRTTGILNVPVAGDLLAFRGAIRRSRRDGYVSNIAPGVPSTLENQDVWNGQAQLRIRPSDTLDVILSASAYRDDTNGFAFRPTIPGFGNFAVQVLRATQPTNPRIVSNDYVNPSNIRSETYALSVEWTPSSETRVKLHGGQSISSAIESIDRDDTAVAFSFLSAADRSKNNYAEIVLTQELGALFQLTAGASYFDENATQATRIGAGIPLFLPPPAPPSFIPVRVAADITFKSKALGAFLQATYNLSESTRFTAGLRYSWERKSYTNSSTVGVGGPPRLVPSFTDKQSWGAVTWLARLSHDFNADVMGYASVSTGFKGGGFNTAVPQRAPAFEPEDILGVEAGLKSVWFDRRVTLNVAAFYYDYKNIQVQKNDPGALVNAIENASAARIFGADIDITYRPTSRLSLLVSAQALDTRFKSYKAFNPYDLAGGLIDLSGRKLSRAPSLSLGGAVDYTLPLENLGEVRFRTDVSYRSTFEFRPFGQSFDREKAYALVNARLTWSPDDRIDVSVFAQNLTDRLYRINLGDPPAPDAPGNYYGAPRTFGVGLAFRF